ncbi:hypothetical protein GCM10010082_17350 [Kushneria pakistanensis]|uniref:Cbb3-type cytochrome oxidase assembly protein CcoS n=1 Tax=Kushneria pakistanensis TaxID=1508770 RepID=A0ABQ3FHW5_9GAMM|nr:hypothetical protein [Kushneria pakistanensis]GHC25080.1 hypothetical protein GCM10010082_17350 [Kushneria pakistanensis]
MGILIAYLVITALAVIAIFSAMGVAANSGHFMESAPAINDESQRL